MSFKLVEYMCPEHQRFESLETRPPPTYVACPECRVMSELVISATPGFSQFVTVERGKFAPPPSPHHLDTSKYGLREEGYKTWREKRTKQLQDLRRAEIKAKLR